MFDPIPVPARSRFGHLPTSRLGKPDDLAAVATLPLSEEAEWIAGQVRYIGGGSHRRQ
jgi:NAD(P)-dependent dehydrogenase (short-subunit alcohol dehydrogenase family)